MDGGYRSWRLFQVDRGGAGHDEPARDTVPTAVTTEEEEREFPAAPDADRPPTAGESQQAEEHGPLDHEVAARAREATELGAEVQGEGEIS